MITAMRKIMKGKIAQTIVIIIVASVGFAYSLTSFLSKQAEKKSIVEVNGRSIYYPRFIMRAQAEERYIRALRSQYGNFADVLLVSSGRSSDPRKNAITQLIREEIIDQVGKKLDVHVEEEAVQLALSDKAFLYRDLIDIIPPELINWEAGTVRYPQLKTYLSGMGLTIEDFFLMVEDLLKRSLVANLIVGSSYVPEFLEKIRYARDYAGKDFSVLTFDFDVYLNEVKKQEIDSKKLKSFFDSQNALTKRYWVPEKRVGKVWEFDHSSYGVVVDDEQAKMYYDDYKRKKYVQTPAKMKVRRILIGKDREGAQQKARQLHSELLADPDLFAQKAKELSDDKESAKNGGLLPEFTRGTYSKDFEKPAFLLKEDGAISSVVQTEDGFEIIQRVARIAQVYKPFGSVKAEIKDRLRQKKFKDQFYKDMKRALSPYAPDQAAREALLKKAKKVTETKPLEKSDGRQVKTIFRTNEGAFGFYAEDNKGFVVQTVKIEKRNLPSLQAIKDTVLGDLYEEQARKKMKRDLEKAKKETLPFEQLKETYKAKLTKTGMIKASDTEKLKKLQAQQIPVQALLQIEAVGAVDSSQSDTDGYLFKLDAVEPFDQAAFQEKKDEIRKGLKKELIQLHVNALIACLHRSAKIKIDETIINLGR